MTSKHIQEPLDRIATGWRVAYTPNCYHIWHRWWGRWVKFTDPKEAKAEYLRLTEVRKERESKGKTGE